MPRKLFPRHCTFPRSSRNLVQSDSGFFSVIRTASVPRATLGREINQAQENCSRRGEHFAVHFFGSMDGNTMAPEAAYSRVRVTRVGSKAVADCRPARAV